MTPAAIAPTDGDRAAGRRDPRAPRGDLERRGKAIARTDATAIVVPPSDHERSRRHVSRGSGTTTRPAGATPPRRPPPSTIGGSGPTRPNKRSPAPVLVHGPTVASRARTAPATATHDPATARSGSGGVVIAGSPSSVARHSGPSTRPRTGTAQARQTGSSHAPHRAIAASPRMMDASLVRAPRRGRSLPAGRSAELVEGRRSPRPRRRRRTPASPLLGLHADSVRLAWTGPLVAWPASMGERIAVLVSGSGTNLQALLDHPVCGPRIALVLSDRPGVKALERAESHGVESAVLDPQDFEDREDVRSSRGGPPPRSRDRRRRVGRVHAPARSRRSSRPTGAAG